jgi:hypothetical protein
MRIRTLALFFTGLVLILGGLASASAENATVRAPSARSEQQNPGPGPAAPVGHRQPQAKDATPADMPPADQATRDLDQALAKKLTICRGC